MTDKEQEKGSSENSTEIPLGCCIGLLAGLALIVFAIVFPFLGLDTQREIVFERLGFKPATLEGAHYQVEVLSSVREHELFDSDKYSITAKRIPTSIGSEDQEGSADPDAPAVGILYTAECQPHCWNLCAGLSPGQKYFARLSSNKHTQIGIWEPGTGKTRIFEVRGLKKIQE
jgi:hypothetical protein